MKLVSFNVNGVRARPHQLERLVEVHSPEVIGLQETKVHDEEFPLGMIEELGYHISYFGQKGHYGVAIMSKQGPIKVQKGFPGDDDEAQKRIISATFDHGEGKPLTVINGYFPQGESREHPTKFPNKQKFYADLLSYLQENHSPDDHLAVMGDMNVASVDQDIGIGPDNAKRWLRTGKCSFLPEEREWLQRLSDWGLEDSFRKMNPDVDDRFSWFDYRSKGFDREPKRGLRIDLIMLSRSLMDACSDTGIDYDIRGMEKPSDHCPIWAEISIG